VLAQKGFVVWQLDNRGSMGRGHRFESVLYHDMGEHELSDQKEGIQYLFSQGFVDPQRIGLYGWSYGGYMTLYTITHAPGLIKAAIAGAPVTNWRNYDTIYTERYMGLPEDDENSYRRSSPVLSAAGNGGDKAPHDSQHRRRQRAFPKLDSNGGGSGEGRQAVLHAGLSPEDTRRLGPGV
jgi:dipeptidyl aminopeptidase/acylaminoacyl peptidase